MDDSTVGSPILDFEGAEASPGTDFFEEPQVDPDDSLVDESPDEPSATFISDKARSVKSRRYEKKMRGLFNTGFRAAISNPATVSDAAAIMMHAEPISRAWGDLADESAGIARAIDYITDGTENPYATAVITTMPLILQMLRNHEPQLEVKERGIKIPFGKRKGERITLKFGVKLRGVRNMTNDPEELATYVFNHPSVIRALEKQGLIVAKSNRRKAG